MKNLEGEVIYIVKKRRYYVLLFVTLRILTIFTSFTVGLGRSEGSHNHVDTFDEYTSVVFQHCAEVNERYPDMPIFLFGNSVVIFYLN
jgi:hypothetical protein